MTAHTLPVRALALLAVAALALLAVGPASAKQPSRRPAVKAAAVLRTVALKSATDLCKVERARLGEAAFGTLYGAGATATCVTGKLAIVGPLAQRAAATCTTSRDLRRCVADAIRAALAAPVTSGDEGAIE